MPVRHVPTAMANMSIPQKTWTLLYRVLNSYDRPGNRNDTKPVTHWQNRNEWETRVCQDFNANWSNKREFCWFAFAVPFSTPFRFPFLFQDFWSTPTSLHMSQSPRKCVTDFPQIYRTQCAIPISLFELSVAKQLTANSAHICAFRFSFACPFCEPFRVQTKAK